MSQAGEPTKSVARLRVGEAIEAEFDALDSFAAGVGRLDDAPLPQIVTPNVHPQERARVRVLAIAKRARPVRAHTKLIEIVRPHPQRREASCVRHETRDGKCGGCPLMSLDEAAQRQAKQARVERALGLRVDAYHAAPQPLGYRWSAKRVVGGRRGALRFGSFIRGSHAVADMGGCQVDHPKIVEALEQLHGRANAMQITAWRSPGDGELRYVWAKTNGEDVLLTLLGSAAGAERLRTLADSLKSAAGVYVGIREGEGNAIRGDETLEHVCGVAELPYEDAGARESIGPLGFLQPNPAVAHAAYEALVREPSGAPLGGELVFDLYAGAGVTTSRLRGPFNQVRPVEAYPESAEALGVPAEDVGDFLADYAGARPELIVANPPRAGFGARVCEQLLALDAPRLQVMSCSPDSFARDLKRLEPGYELVRLELFDTLPQTAHVELVAWFRTKSAARR